MLPEVKIPIRRKILAALIVAVTLVVSVITFTMASFFHADKREYIHDWVSIAAVSTAEECRALLLGHKQRLGLYAEIMLNPALDAGSRSQLLRRMFDEVPELVEVAVHRDGKLLEVARDVAELEAAELSVATLDRALAQTPRSADALPAAGVEVRNATLAASLPAFRIVFPYDPESAGDPVVISGLLRADELLRLGSRFKVFDVTLVDGQDHVLGHRDLQRIVDHAAANLAPQAAALRDGSQAGLTLHYEREGTEMIAGFAAVSVAGLLVAAEIPAATAYLASRALAGRLFVVALGLLLVGAVGGLLWAGRITRPVEHLSRATRVVAGGNFDVTVEAESRDEIGALASSFNDMAVELKRRERALVEAQAQLVQSEKMAAFGQLGAGIAHEVKNPLTGVLGCAELALLDVEQGTDLHENLRLIEKETKRCRDIIENLLRFARQEKVARQPTDVNVVVRDAVAIVRHQIAQHSIRLECELAAELPSIQGSANQLQQVVMNLLINAQQALDGKPGELRVSTRRAGQQVVVVIQDDGPGIPPEIQKRIFEPFFTTKPAGRGTGLGLSVSFGIVRDHGGEIAVRSRPGEGATFEMSFPALAAAEPEPAAEPVPSLAV